MTTTALKQRCSNAPILPPENTFKFKQEQAALHWKIVTSFKLTAISKEGDVDIVAGRDKPKGVSERTRHEPWLIDES